MKPRRLPHTTCLLDSILAPRTRAVYKGIIKNPEIRAVEHKRQGKKFTSMTASVKVSQKTARKREKKGIKSYMKIHPGKKPRYNKKI